MRINKIHGDTSNAYKFDPKYQKFELIFPQTRVYRPSMGLRQFWKHNLPTLKFHNFDREFLVKKIATENDEDLKKCPVKLTVYDDKQKLFEIKCDDTEHSEILKKLVEMTEAQPVSESEIKALDIKIN